MKTGLSFLILLPLLPLPLAAQSGAITWHRIPAGGGISQNSGWQVSGVITPSCGGGSFSAGYGTPGFVAATTPAVQNIATGQNASFGGNASSRPASSVVFAGGGVALSFTGLPGMTYSIQRSTNLVAWDTIWITNAPAAGFFKYTDTFAGFGGVSPGAAFYRLGWHVP